MKKIMHNLEEVYILNDNFVKFLEQQNLKRNPVGRKSTLSVSEYMTLIMLQQELGIRINKVFYFLIKNLFQKHFSKLPSYQQFNEGLRYTLPYLLLLTSLLINKNKKKKAKFYIVDSTPLPICANAYRYNLKIDFGLAKTGKNLNGWFHGFKAHLITNHNLEIVGLCFSDGAKKDYNVLNGNMIKDLTGWLIGDKGYICSQVSQNLAKQGLFLLTRTRKNMKKFPATNYQNYLLSKRETIETVFSILKSQLNMITQGAKSLLSFFSKIFAAILLYCICKTQNLKKYDYLDVFSLNLIS